MNHPFTFRIVLLLGGVFLFSACNVLDEIIPDRNAKRREAETQVLKAKNSVGPYRLTNSESPEINAMPSKPGLYTKPLTNNYQFDNSWRIPDQAIREYFAAHQHDLTLFREEQLESCMMLDKYLLRQKKNDKEVQPAIAYYLDLLVKHRNTEFALIAQALEKLDGYWTGEQLAGVSATVLAYHKQAQAKRKPVNPDVYVSPIVSAYDQRNAGALTRIERIYARNTATGRR